MYFDTHAHYDSSHFDADRHELLASMPDAGVDCIIDPGCDEASSRAAIALAERYPFVYAAVGWQPEEWESWDCGSEALVRELARHPKCVAIGEIGLDYYWDKEEEVQKNQRIWFRRQLELAKESNLPVIIHSRDAAADTMEIMKEAYVQGIKGVIHCFSYSKEQAQEYVKMGYYIGVGGVATFKNAKKLKEVIETIPLEKILLETDCPYMAPEPYRGKRNSSLYLPYVVEKIAGLKGVTAKEVEEVTYRNAEQLFLGK